MGGRGVLALVAGAVAAGLLTAGPAGATTPAAPVVGQVAGYSADTANEEAYWYSRYSMMTLTMQSGLGTAIPMTPALQSMMMQWMAQVGAAPSDPVMPPMNATLLATIYAGGDPHYRTAPNQSDFSTLTWVGGAPVLTTESTAFTIEKEIEWAKLFHRDGHFGQAGVDTFGSTQRFVGVLLANMAKMQVMAYEADASHYRTTKAGDYALLTALSDGAAFYASSDQANDQGPAAGPATYPAENRYNDPAAAAQFQMLADAAFSRVVASHPTTVRDLNLAIQSVVWYAATTHDPATLATARAALLRWGHQLADADAEGPAALANQVRGLIEVGRTTGRDSYLGAAAHAFRELTEHFDAVHGVLSGTHRLTTDDVGTIAGAFNAAGLFLGDRIDQTRATATYAAWWEGTVDQSGFEISSPAVDQMKMPYELLDPPGRGTTPQPTLNYRYPTVPLPQDAGGTYGAAPVFAASITWTGHHWVADHNWFDTAGAMHAANELIWFHSDEINGFPDVTLP
jgi:hypothetical protein